MYIPTSQGRACGAIATRATQIVSAIRVAARRWEASPERRFRKPEQNQPPPTGAQVYRIIVALDIEQFGDPHRDDQVRMQLRRALYETVAEALNSGGIPSDHWQSFGTGDGLLLLAEPTVETAKVLRALLDRLPDEITNYNRTRIATARLRTRAVLHGAHVMLDEHGAVGEQIVLVFRLLDSDPLRGWLRRTVEPVVVAVSEDVYRQVVCQRVLGLDPASFQALAVNVKETSARAWVHSRIRRRTTAPVRSSDRTVQHLGPGEPAAA